MIKIKTLLLLIIISLNASAQTVTNGGFTSGGASWGCTPETNPESVYGGSGSNRVAEVDAAVGLCQTITGFTIGAVYQFTFDCSRRTSCGPATQTLDFTIDGGVLPTQNISRTGAFNFTQEAFSFTASSTSHTIEFDGTSAGTCGLIIDNIAVSLVSGLPIKLLNFNVKNINNSNVLIDWQTASEINNDFFTIERSVNGFIWEKIIEVDGAGNSFNTLSYFTTDNDPYYGISYYRLKQTDFDGQFSYSQTLNVDLNRIEKKEIKVFPNPATKKITIVGEALELQQIKIYNSLGQDVTISTKKINNIGHEQVLDLSNLKSGFYYINSKENSIKFYKKN